MRTRARRGLTFVELTLSLAIFSVLSLILAVVLRQVSALWVRTNARDEAMRQLLKARTSLMQDLGNAVSRPDGFALSRVGPNLGANYDGDALTFLTSDSGRRDDSWQIQLGNGSALPAAQITYYLVIPNVPGITADAAAGADGYEQYHPRKWLIRRVDIPTGAALATDWTTWLTRPGSMALGPSTQVVAADLLGFRVRSGPPLWTIELSATRISEAQRKIRLGGVPLAESTYTLHQRISLRAHN